MTNINTKKPINTHYFIILLYIKTIYTRYMTKKSHIHEILRKKPKISTRDIFTYKEASKLLIKKT